MHGIEGDVFQRKELQGLGIYGLCVVILSKIH